VGAGAGAGAGADVLVFCRRVRLEAYLQMGLEQKVHTLGCVEREGEETPRVRVWPTVVVGTVQCISRARRLSCHRMYVSHLPVGPTAMFKLSSSMLGVNIPGHGRTSQHIPEIILNRFTTRLGQRVGRLLGSMFPHVSGRDVTFVGCGCFPSQQRARACVCLVLHRTQSSRVVVWLLSTTSAISFSCDSTGTCSQRISRCGGVFFLAHVQTGHDHVRLPPPLPNNMVQGAKLQELGPRFTLKPRWLQAGTFDTKEGEYEWIHKRHEMDTSRRRFHL